MYYAIGECGHTDCCWNCILRQRLKVENDECPHCKQSMTKVLFSSKKDDSLKTNKQAICDPNYGIYYENAECKKFIQEYLGFYCMTCKKSKNQVRKF